MTRTLLAAMFVALSAVGTPEASAQTGGARVVLEVNTDKYLAARSANLLDRVLQDFDNAEPPIAHSSAEPGPNAPNAHLLHLSDRGRARAIADTSMVAAGETVMYFAITEDGVLSLRVDDAGRRSFEDNAVVQTINIMRKRLDPTGENNVEIRRDGRNRIIVEARGVSEPASLRDRLGPTSVLSVNLVDDNVPADDLDAGRIPAGRTLAPPYPEIGAEAVVVLTEPEFTGEHLTRAAPMYDPNFDAYVVSFGLDAIGQHALCRITTEHPGRRFAVLLDGQVLTAPTINEPICGGTGVIHGTFTQESASELAVKLIGGALPAPLSVVEMTRLPAKD